MSRKILTTLLAAASVLVPAGIMPASPAMAQNVTRPATEVVLSVGKGQLVNVNGTMADIFVANEAIADVQVKSPRQLYVFGKAGGETTVYASNAAGDVIWSATVRVGSNIDSVDQMLMLAMPEANIQVNTMNNTVLLTGTVASPDDAAEAERLVKAFTGDATNVISRLRTATPLQVNLQVRIAEVSRSFIRDIGANLLSIDSSSGFQFGIGQGRKIASTYAPRSATGVGTGKLNVQIPDINNPGGFIPYYPPGGGPPIFLPDPNNPQKFVDVIGTSVDPVEVGTSLVGAGRFLGVDLLGALDLGEQAGMVTTLSNPNLTALSGETADFLAGGEFPIPVSQGLGTTAIEYRNYGVSLSYTPTVLSNGRISMRVRPEVSELSSQGSVTLNGFQVPALTIRRAETTVELGSGQSFMIAGLMSNSSQNALQKAPGIGDVPILGSLFRSTNFRRGETELVIVVTPYLVQPVNGNDIKLPTDGFQNPDEAQRLFGHMSHDGITGGDRPKPTAVDSAGNGPNVGSADGAVPPLPAPAAPAENRQATAPAQPASPGDRRTRANATSAAAAAPGFSLD